MLANRGSHTLARSLVHALLLREVVKYRLISSKVSDRYLSRNKRSSAPMEICTPLRTYIAAESRNTFSNIADEKADVFHLMPVSADVSGVMLKHAE